jgi:branched-chain amino acid transport system substrate-binding protein
MHRTRVYQIPLALILTFTFSLLPMGCRQPESKVLDVGVIAPLTGTGQVYGTVAKQGLEIALGQINSKGGVRGFTFRLIFEDDQLDPQLGKSALNKLVSVDKVSIVIGPFTSGVSMAVAPDAERMKVVLLSPTASNYKLKDAGDYFFRVCPSDAFQGDILARVAYEDFKARNVAVLYMNTDYGYGLQEIFSEVFKSVGGKIIASEAFPQGATDFRAQITKLKHQKPDLVFIPSNYSEAASFLKQARELGFRARFLGGDGSFDPQLLKLAGQAADGLILSTQAFADTSKPIVKDFILNYRHQYKEDPTPFASLWFDALHILGAAVDTALSHPGSEPLLGSAEIQKALLMAEFDGVTGLTRFDKYGEVKKPFSLYIVQNGQFVMYKKDAQ